MGLCLGEKLRPFIILRQIPAIPPAKIPNNHDSLKLREGHHPRFSLSHTHQLLPWNGQDPSWLPHTVPHRVNGLHLRLGDGGDCRLCVEGRGEGREERRDIINAFSKWRGDFFEKREKGYNTGGFSDLLPLIFG